MDAVPAGPSRRAHLHLSRGCGVGRSWASDSSARSPFSPPWACSGAPTMVRYGRGRLVLRGLQVRPDRQEKKGNPARSCRPTAEPSWVHRVPRVSRSKSRRSRWATPSAHSAARGWSQRKGPPSSATDLREWPEQRELPGLRDHRARPDRKAPSAPRGLLVRREQRAQPDQWVRQVPPVQQDRLARRSR